MAPSAVLSQPQHEISLVGHDVEPSAPGIVVETVGNTPSVEALRLEPRPPGPASPRGLAGFGALGRL